MLPVVLGSGNVVVIMTRKRKLDWKALAQHIQENPDALLRERAQYFGVHPLCDRVCHQANEVDSSKKTSLNHTEII